MRWQARATFMADGAADPHIRFNVAMCQAPAVADYLRERLNAIDGANRVLKGSGLSSHRAED